MGIGMKYNVLDKLTSFLDNNIGEKTNVFYENLKIELEGINSLNKQSKYLKLLVLELKKEQLSQKKEILELKDKLKQAEKRYKISYLDLKINCIKELLEQIKVNLRKEIVTENKPKFNYHINEEQEEKITETKDINIDNLEDEETVDLIVMFTDFIKNCDIMENTELIKKYSKILTDRLVENVYEKENIFPEFDILLSTLKIKSISFEKNTEQREIIKEVLNNFKDIYKIYKEDKVNSKESPYFDIINYLLQDDQNYLYIKEILKRKREVYNIKHNDEHIVIYILDLYINNFKKMIRDKDSDYININYLKQVYFLFTKNYNVTLTYEEKQIIDLKLKEFNFYIKNTLIKQKRKNAAINETKQLKSRMFYKPINRFEFQEFTDDELGYFKTEINNNSKNYVKDKPSTDAFLIGENAYKLRQEDGITFLTMYGMDVHSYLVRNSYMDRYLEKCELCKEKIDEFTASGFKFKLDGKYPAIAYELEFYPSGKFKNLKVSRDIIAIKNHYTNPDTNEESKNIYNLYHNSVAKNGGTISTYDLYKLNEHFETILNNAYVEFLKEQKLPTIYYGYSLSTDKEIEHNLNNVTNSLSDLTKTDSRDIINIFSSKIDIPHYSNLPMDNGVHNFRLLDTFNYLGIENTRMLSELYFNDFKLEDIKRITRNKLQYLSNYIKKVEELNSSLDYVDTASIKLSRGKIKNKLHL